MRKITAALALALLSGAAYSQSGHFEGLSVGVGLGYVRPEITEWDNAGGGNYYAWKTESAIPQLNFTYNFALSDKWLLGVGGSYDLSKLEAGTTRGNSGPVKATLDEHSSVYLQPTFALSDKSAIHVKVASHEAKMDAVGLPGAGWIPDRHRFSGEGFGLGYTRFVGKNLFVQGEVQTVKYKDWRYMSGSSTVVYTLKTEIALITLGYKF